MRGAKLWTLWAVLGASAPSAATPAAPGTIIVTLPESLASKPFSVPQPMVASCTPTAEPKAADGKDGHPGDALRTRLGLKVPEAETLVIIHGIAAHHGSKQWSIVAWRDSDTPWTVERGGEAGSGLLQTERLVFAPQRKTLGIEEGRRLDMLMSDAGIFEEQPRGEEPFVGSLNSTMEIISTAGRRTICWSGRLQGKLGAIADQVIGPY